MTTEPTDHPLLAVLPLVKLVAKRHGARVRVVSRLGDVAELEVTCSNGRTAEVALDDDIPGMHDITGDWTELGDGEVLAEYLANASTDSTDSDNEWLREQAREAGMLHGCRGYNNAMGWG
jgi:hypothetical protein